MSSIASNAAVRLFFNKTGASWWGMSMAAPAVSIMLIAGTDMSHNLPLLCVVVVGRTEGGRRAKTPRSNAAAKVGEKEGDGLVVCWLILYACLVLVGRFAAQDAISLSSCCGRRQQNVTDAPERSKCRTDE